MSLDCSTSRLTTLITVVAAAGKVRIDAWISAAKITEGRVFRPLNKGDRVTGEFITRRESHLAAGWLVVHYARDTSLGKLAPHDLRRSSAKLCRKAGGEV